MKEAARPLLLETEGGQLGADQLVDLQDSETEAENLRDDGTGSGVLQDH